MNFLSNILCPGIFKILRGTVLPLCSREFYYRHNFKLWVTNGEPNFADPASLKQKIGRRIIMPQRIGRGLGL